MNCIKNKFYYLFILTGLLLVIESGCDDKNQVAIPLVETGSFTDPVNNDVYRTVKIGDKWWMAENLIAKKYRNGNPVNLIQDDTSLWRKDTIGAYCVYDKRANAIGLLYNWYAVNNQNNLAPEGWHIATDEEWNMLEISQGMSITEVDKLNWRGGNNHVANKLKKEAQLGFSKYTEDTWATNESGFSAMGAGCRLFNGKWGDPGLFCEGFWWTATSESNNKAWYRYMDYKSIEVFRNYLPRTYGFSVRCVKD